MSRPSAGQQIVITDEIDRSNDFIEVAERHGQVHSLQELVLIEVRSAERRVKELLMHLPKALNDSLQVPIDPGHGFVGDCKRIGSGRPPYVVP